MRIFNQTSIIAGLLMLSGIIFGQQKKSEPLWGTPCAECINSNTENSKGGPSSVQNGNATIATSYTTTACGLNFTQASVRLNKRSFSITPATGVNQPATFAISGIPPCFTIVKAFLYAGTSGNGIAVTANITNPTASTAAFPMTIIGQDQDKCWSYSGSYTYRADVTSIISGNGNYIISGLPVTVGSNDTDGATLFIIYSDPAQNYTGSIVIADGCNVAKGGNKNVTISGFKVCGPPSLTTNFMIVADLQKIAATPINLNSATSNYTHPTTAQQVWDYIQQPGAPAVNGQTTAQYGISNSSDCYNFCMAGMYYRTTCNVCTSTNLTVTAVASSSCSAGSATANVSGGTAPYTYTWSPTGGNSSTVTGVPTGVYTVTVKDATGCKTGTATVNISSAAAPTITGTSGTICAGGSTTLTAGGGITYTWSPATGLSTTSGSVVVASPAASTTYTISGSNASGCVGTRTVSVLVNPIPVPVINSNSPVCLNASINLTSGGGTSYAWSGPNAFSSAVQNPTITGATTANAGVYTVTVTSLGCTATATTNVVINTPTTSASNTGPYCAGATIQLNAPAATSYTWSGPGGFASNLQNPTIPSSTTGMSGTYTVLVNIGACPAIATTSVTVNALPTPIASNTGPYCPGNTIQLNVGAFTTYTWSGPSSFSSNVQNATVPSAATTNGGVYTVSVTNANGCINSSTTNVVVNPTPNPIVGSNSPVCLNNNINLTASGGTSYSWSGPNSFSSALQNPTINGATSVNAGVYTVTVTALGCTNTGTVSVTVLTPTTTAANTGPYCAGSTIQLNTPAATSYTWTGPGGFTSNMQNPTLPSSTTGMSGTYSVLVSAGTCTANATTIVIVNALPTPAASNTGPYCPGNTIQLNVGAFTTYTWSGPSAYSSNVQNATVPSAAVSNGGVYTVSVTNANGCVNSTTTNVVVNPSPVPVVGSNSPVCLNNNINLTASGGTSYSWSGPSAFSSALQNPTINGATTVNSGVYTVTVTALGCTNTGTVNVTVLTPTTSASNTGAYCAGATIQLSTPAATSYTWSGPGGFTSNLQSPNIPASTTAMSGTYSVLVSAGSCTANATTNVVVNALPTPTALSNSPVCATTPINLTGAGGTTYTWTGPGGFTSNSQNPVILSATAANAGTNTLTVTDANGCVNSTTVSVVVNPLPIITVNNPTVCVNQSIGLTAAGGATYAWSGPAGFTSNQQNPNIPSAVLNMGGAYTVTVTTAAGCSNTAVSNVQVFALPNPQIVSNSPVCAGGSLNLSGAGGASFAWAGPNSFMSLQQNPTISNVTLAASGVYTLLVSSGSCTAATTASVTINPLPTPQIVSNSPVCVNQPINLTGSGGVSYAWSGPAFISNVQNPVISSAALVNSGTFTLTVTDANNCVNSITQNVIVNPLPNPTAVGGTACENSNVSLAATGGVSYSWAGPGGFSAIGSNVNIPNAQTSSNGQYTVTVTDANNCTNTAMTMITVNPAPVANIVTNSPICENTTLNLSGTGGVSYQWSGPNGYISSSQNSSINSVSASYSGNYNLTVTDANGCTASTSTAVTINPIPNAIIASSNNVGCAPMCVTFTVNSTSQIANYNWNLGNGVSGNTATQQTCYGTTGVYTINVSVSDAIGCSSSATYTVQVYPQPVADFNHAPIKPIINIDPEVVFTDASYGANIVSWNWYFMNNAQFTSTQQNPTFMYTEPGTYAVALVVKSDKGCMDTLVRPLVVGEDFGIYVPNAFTPNEDGLNDIFMPKGFGIVKYELQIFDRWGERIFSSADLNEGWDGKYEGRGGDIIEEGVYTWLINVTSVFGKAHELKGHVTLIK